MDTVVEMVGIPDAPEVHARLGKLFQGLGPYRLRGRVACQWGVPSLELEDAERLDLPE